MFRKLLWMLKQPEEVFEGVREEGCGEPFIFRLRVSAVIAFFAPIVDYLGSASTDRTSTYQAQILAWRITSEQLLPCLGAWAYVLKPSSYWGCHWSRPCSWPGSCI